MSRPPDRVRGGASAPTDFQGPSALPRVQAENLITILFLIRILKRRGFCRMPCGQSFEQAQVLRRDTGYHSYRLGADMLRWSVFLSRTIGTLSRLRTAGRGGEG